jgi:hypothetical protein
VAGHRGTDQEITTTKELGFVHKQADKQTKEKMDRPYAVCRKQKNI